MIRTFFDSANRVMDNGTPAQKIIVRLLALALLFGIPFTATYILTKIYTGV